MFEYSFVSVPVKRKRAGKFLEEDYRDIIRKHAKRGWQFVQAITFDDHIDPRVDLVFSRKVDR